MEGREKNIITNPVISATSMSTIGSQLRNMPIPSPPSLSSSSEDDSDDISDIDDENTGLDCFNSNTDLSSKFLLGDDGINKELSNLTLVGPETQAKLEALLEAAGVAADGKAFTDPEVLRRLTSSVSSALDEAAEALTRMRSQAAVAGNNQTNEQGTRSLVEACIEGDIAAVRKLLDEGRSVHEPTDEGESLLSLACSAGYYELVQVLLAMNANVEDRGSKGDCTPLMEAASGGFEDIVQLLLQHGANINAQSSSGNTALHYACCSGYETVVQSLIQHNADLEHQNENGHTPLMEAASGGHVKVAKLLLDNGAGINTHSSEFKESALTLACYKGHVDMVFFLLERGADQEHKTDEMHTALMEASMDGHVEVARLLLDHGAQVNMPADSFESPLTLAACGSHVELAQLLIEHGANLEEVNDEGYTPLMEAGREGYLPMVALLLENGAKINAQTEETQETALTLACCGGFQEVVCYLLEHGAHIELGASTPLMEAATEGHVDLVRYLLEKGANVNASTATGDSALTYAAENGHTDVTEVLIDNGAHIEHRSEGGRTPLMKAARAGHLCTVEFLISKGADVNCKTSGDEHSVLSLACAGGHSSIVELLLTCGGNPSTKLKDNSSMLIEAAKGGHANVACLLINAQMQQKTFLTPESSIHPGFTSPVSTASQLNSSSYHMCEHMQPQNDALSVNANCHQRDCQFHCQHLQQPILQQQLSQTSDCFGNSPHNCAFVPPVNQANLATNNYGSLLAFDEPFKHDVDVNTSPTDLFLPNTPVSLSSSLSLANLTPADLQSLAQALSFSSSVNASLQQDQYQQQQAAEQLAQHASHLIEQDRMKEGVTENLGLSTSITFPAVDPQVESFTTQSEVCTPSPSDTTTALVTSAGRTIASTGVQTEDAISMIQKLTNSVHQLNALQNFAAAHNLELVNLGEITLPPAPFSIDEEVDDEIMVADSAQTLQNSLLPVSSTREGPIGECCGSPHADPIIPAPSQSPITPPMTPVIDIDQATESNHDTALTIACAGGHDELVQLLLSRGANIEHRDKKGCTPLILSATAGHVTTCHILLEHGADIEAQSDRTKDTALSLACSSGRQEVVELLLMSNANFEHRNVSDYTPLSLAASGGYVGIIKILLNHGAEINSRTGSKLGISPLMLASMNGLVAAVKLLLDRGSDVNAQIETNRNTALTLACFQGRTEVVGLLLDRKANIEHRAKTGLTPLMEAASGGYVDVGTVLIDRGADVNAPPVPSSRDTALTIAADKGHYKFVELLIIVGAQVEVKNKKGCSPLWLGANGGHLDVVQLLADEYADVNATDNRGVSCLMAAFRKGHIKVVKWLVKHVSQFPPDIDCKRYLQTVTDPELLKKLEECHQIINAAKKRQEAEANKNASILLEELDYEKKMEEQRKAAAQKKRDKKKQKKKKKTSSSCGDKQCNGDMIDDDDRDDDFDRITGFPFTSGDERTPFVMNDERPDLSAAELKLKSQKQGRKKKEKKIRVKSRTASAEIVATKQSEVLSKSNLDSLADIVITTGAQLVSSIKPLETISASTVAAITKALASSIMTNTKSTFSKLPLDDKVTVTMVTAAAQSAIISLSTATSSIGTASSSSSFTSVSPRKSRRSDEGWKEVTRNVTHSRSKKTVIPASLISRVIGRGGCNVNAIREYTGALIDIDTNRKKANGDCMVTIKGSQPAVRQATNLIQCLIDDPERDVSEILPVATKTTPPKNETLPLPTFPTTLRTNNISKSLNMPKSPAKILTQRQLSAPLLSNPQTTNSIPINTPPTSTMGKLAIKTSQKPLTVAVKSSKVTIMTTTTETTSPVVNSTNWNSDKKPLFVSKSNKVSDTSLSNESMNTVTQLISATQSTSNFIQSTSSRVLFSPVITASESLLQKTYPQPIGSNRPKQYDNSIPLSSTLAGNSIAATLHSTLTNLLSQVATQRSPMIWNDSERRHTRREFSTTATTISSSPITLNGHCDRFSSNSISQGSSQDSSAFLHQSRTPSLSPTSNHSNSPTPETERPHLNPIGSERGNKKIIDIERSPEMVSMMPDSSSNMWHFEQKSSSWLPPAQQQPIGWPSGGATNKAVPPSTPHRVDDKKLRNTRHNETLSSLLEKLSLSNHYFLFQKNEIDLDALMLMSEQDYADIGLPKEARLKLMSSVRRLHPGINGSPPTFNVPPNTGIMGGGPLPHQSYMIKPMPTQSSMWNQGFQIDHALPPNNILPTNTRLPPEIHNGIAFQPVSNQWANWSGQIDQ